MKTPEKNTNHTAVEAKTSADTSTGSPLRRSIEHTVAMQTSAALCTFLFYPLDSVKYRIMSQDGTVVYNYHKTGKDFPGLYRALKDTYKYEGLTALYRGVVLAIVATVISWGIYMLVYKYLHFFYNKHTSERSIIFDYSASLFASVLCAALTNPVWLIKTRMQLQDRTATDAVYYRSFFHGGREIIRREGFRALFRGIVPQMLLSVPNAFYIPLYECFKRTAVQITTPDITRPCNFWEIVICSSIAKAIITVVSNPLLVIKTKIQDHRNATKDMDSSEVKYKGMRSTLLTAIRREGILKGLFLRGLNVGLAQKILRSTSHLLMYELFVRMFKI